MATIGKCSLKLPLVTSCCSYELVQESYYICAKERGILPKEWNQFTSNVSTRPVLRVFPIVVWYDNIHRKLPLGRTQSANLGRIRISPFILFDEGTELAEY
jgi:hypothetical protein